MSYNAQNHRRFIPFSEMTFTTGTWTTTYVAGVGYSLKTATDETSTVDCPIVIAPRRSDFDSIKLKTVELIYRATTEDLDAAPTLALRRLNTDIVVAAGTGNVGTNTLTTTSDAVATAAAADRRATFTVDSAGAIFDFSDKERAHYHATFTLNAAATTVIRVYGVEVTYEAIT